MNWFRTILDGVAMSAVFNGVVAVFWLLKPHSFIVMFPKSLQKKARPVTRDERRHTILMYATLYPAVLVWMILSDYQADRQHLQPLKLLQKNWKATFVSISTDRLIWCSENRLAAPQPGCCFTGRRLRWVL